jgi:hypothetical protein
MFIIDDILASPIRGLLWVFREVQNAAEEDQANAAQQITQQLAELYQLLETGKISEAEFEVQEEQLLDRLDQMDAARAD